MRTRPLVWWLVGLLLAAVLGLGALLWAGAHYSRPSPQRIGAPPSDLPARTAPLATADGTPVAGWFVPGRPGQGAVLLLHRKGGSRLDMLGRARWLYAAGFSVLLIDLPAHGESPGRRVSMGPREAEAVRAAWAWLLQALPQQPAGVIADSLGAAALLFARLEPAPRAVVLESLFPTLDEAVENRLVLHLGAPGRWVRPLFMLNLPLQLGLWPSQVRPIEELRVLRSPVLVMSGDADVHTTLAQTQRLFDAAPPPKELWIVPGAAHQNLHAYDRAAYEARVLPFLLRHLRGGAPGPGPGV